MLVCAKCGYVASESDDCWEHHSRTSYLEGRPIDVESWMTCPDCGSDEIVSAVKCDHCGEYFDPNTLVIATIEYPPDDEYPDGSEETKEVCIDCYEEYYFKEEDV